MKKTFDYKKWLWLLYPITVLLLILFTVQFMFGGSGQTWVQLSTTQEKIKADREYLGQLSQKQATLQQLNMADLNSQLQWSEQAVPSSKDVSKLVAQLKYAAVQSGSILVAYRGNIGAITSAATESAQTTGLRFSAQIQTADFASLVQLLKTLESSFPLLNIGRLKMEGTTVDIEFTSAWQPPQILMFKADEPLPPHQDLILQLQSQLTDFVAPQVEVPAATDSAETVTDPFAPLPSSN